MIEQAKFAYSPLGKVFKKQIKAIEEQGKKQVKALKVLKPEKKEDKKSVEGIFPKAIRNNEIKNQLYDTKTWEEKIKRKDLKYRENKHTYDF